MNAKPNPEKPAIVVFFIIFAIMLIAALMFILNDMMKSCYFDSRNNKYLTWAIDGYTVPKPITFLKESAEWSDSESEAFFEEMKQTTDAFFIDNEGYIYRKEPENK